MRVCVIGCGIIGASVAYRLAGRTGVTVAVVDGRPPGGGTTAVSFAWANANAKRPYAYFALNHAGMREYDRLAAELGEAGWRHDGGRLQVPGDADHVAELAGWDYPAELLDVRLATRELEPALNLGDPDGPVAYFPTEFGVDAVRLTGLLTAAAARRGVSFRIGTPVTGVDACGPGFAVRLADGGEVAADVVVNATGGAAPEVGAWLGRPLPMASTRGLTTLVRADRHPLGRIVHTPGLDVRPEGADHLRLHFTPYDEDARDPGAAADDLLRRLHALIPGLDGAYTTAVYAGVRPIPGDGVTSLGPVPGTPGAYEAVTHSGVTLGPLLGRLLADEITDGTVDPLIEPFRPDRFPSSSRP